MKTNFYLKFCITNLLILIHTSAFATEYCLGQAAVFAKGKLAQSLSQQQPESNLTELIKQNTKIITVAMASNYDNQNHKLNTVYSVQLSYQPPTQLQARPEQIGKPWQIAIVKNMQIIFQSNTPNDCSIETAQIVSAINNEPINEASKAANRARQALKNYGLEQ